MYIHYRFQNFGTRMVTYNNFMVIAKPRKWKTGLRFFYFLGKSCSFFRFFFLCVIFQWAPILKLFILKSFITEAVIIQKLVWYLYDNGPCHERVRPIASFKSNKSNNTFFVIKHLWFWFISYVESVTSNSEIGHSRLSKQSPYKNRGPVRPCPFLRIWKVQPHPPISPLCQKREEAYYEGQSNCKHCQPKINRSHYS